MARTEGCSAVGSRGREQALVLDAAEIGALEQLGRQDDLGALGRGLAHELADRADVRVGVVGEGELQRSDGEFGHAGTCCEMQWKLPPPVRMWSALRPIATRSGNRAWTTSTAATIVRRAVLRHDDRGVADVEVHVARRDDIAVLVGDPARARAR